MDNTAKPNDEKSDVGSVDSDAGSWPKKGSSRAPYHEVAGNLSSPITSTLSQNDADHHQRDGDRGDSPEASSPKRAVPRGHDLTEAQLVLQEKILSKIADQAIKEAQTGAKGKSQTDLNHGEEKPEDLDRELEVTQETMKMVRKYLDDGSYRDACLFDDEGKEESTSGILREILLMLKRDFRDTIAKFERPYRPTGFAVTDQELAKEMDEELQARKSLMRRFPLMTIQGILDRLDAIGDEADLRTLSLLLK